MANHEWEYFDAWATFLERDQAREDASFIVSEQNVGRSGGFHPAPGEYVIDPDYMEILNLTPEELIRRKK